MIPLALILAAILRCPILFNVRELRLSRVSETEARSLSFSFPSFSDSRIAFSTIHFTSRAIGVFLSLRGR